MENVYAQALRRTIEGGAKPHEAVKRMHESLERMGRLALWPKIARAFSRLAQTRKSESEMTITVADTSYEHKIPKDAVAALVGLGIDASNVETRIDPSIIGGWRLEGSGHLIDASYKKYLLDMYNRAVK